MVAFAAAPATAAPAPSRTKSRLVNTGVFTEMSFFDNGFRQLYRSWGRWHGEMTVGAEKVGVCGRD
jgi:hypothetical protein